MTASAPVAKYACLTIECEGSGLTKGLGFSIALRHTEHPLTANGEAWRMDTGRFILSSIRDSVFHSTDGEKNIQTLVDKLLELNKLHPKFQIGSYNGVPALQIDSLDGRRLEIDIDVDGKAIIKKIKQAKPTHGLNGEGSGGYYPHQKTPFLFLGIGTLCGASTKKAPKSPGR